MFCGVFAGSFMAFMWLLQAGGSKVPSCTGLHLALVRLEIVLDDNCICPNCTTPVSRAVPGADACCCCAGSWRCKGRRLLVPCHASVATGQVCISWPSLLNSQNMLQCTSCHKSLQSITEVRLTKVFCLLQRVEPKQAPEQVVQQAREVVQLHRRPGLSESATRTLLLKVPHFGLKAPSAPKMCSTFEAASLVIKHCTSFCPILQQSELVAGAS